MAILAGNRHLRLKVMLRGPKLWVNLILNAIGDHLRFTGTQFDHNRYIIRIFIFWFFYRSLWSHAKVSDPLYRGVPKILFRKFLFLFVVSNPFHVLEVGKTLNQNFSIYHPSQILSNSHISVIIGLSSSCSHISFIIGYCWWIQHSTASTKDSFIIVE